MRITGQFGYTHKDPERVYELSRVKVCAPENSAIQKPGQNGNNMSHSLCNHPSALNHIQLVIGQTGSLRNRELVPDIYIYWRELPQVSFLPQQNTSFVATKLCLPRRNVCRDKIMFVATKNVFCVLSRLADFCRDERRVFVATKICLSRQKFYRNKHTSVETKDVFCRDKHVFVATKRLSRQKLYLWQLPPMIDILLVVVVVVGVAVVVVVWVCACRF